MLQSLLGALDAPTVISQNGSVALAQQPARPNNNNNNNNNNDDDDVSNASPTNGGRPSEGKDNEDAVDEDGLANELLTAFPTYGTRSQAHQSHGQLADWVLGGTSGIPTVKQQQMQQQYQQLQMQLLAEELAAGGGGGGGGAGGGGGLDNKRNPKDEELKRFAGDWEEDQQRLWKSNVATTMHDENSNMEALVGTNRRPTTDDEDRARHQRYLYGTPYQRPRLEDASKQMMAAYYYHVGVMPKEEQKDDEDMSSSLTFPYRRRDDMSTVKRDLVGASPSPYHPQYRSSPFEDDVKDMEETKSADAKLSVLAANGTKSIIPDDRQHWMPDQLCKTCYACEKEFTVFRRRHHCRICGQIFCNACSANFVPATLASGVNITTMDSLKTSGRSIENDGSSSSMVSSPQMLSKKFPSTTLTTGTPTLGTAMPGIMQPSSGGSGGSNNTVLRCCKMCYDQVNARQEKLNQLNGDNEQPILDASGRKRRKNPPEVPALMQGPLISSGPEQFGTSASALNTPQHASVPGGNKLLHKQLDDSSSVLHRLSQRTTETSSSLHSTDHLLSQQQAMERDENELTSSMLPPGKKSEKEGIGGCSGRVAVAPLARHTSQSSHETGTTSVVEDRSDLVREGNRHLGQTAATHLEQMLETLLVTDAPLLWQQIFDGLRSGDKRPQPYSDTHRDDNVGGSSLKMFWINKLMSLATRCCATVDPNIKKGDMLDIRPYVKIKVIPGGSFNDSSYMSGVIFRKTGTNKQMPREILNPRIMLLSGGIEFTRMENRIASLDTLLEQEDKYIEILVGKILKLKPDVLIVGKAVSRSAQELLLKNNIQLLQHVKASLLSRISRQTGATVISSTDHIMNQFGAYVLGKCHRFRFIVARDNEAWMDGNDSAPSNLFHGGKRQQNVQALLNDPKLSHHKRHAALAAKKLGEDILDGSEAIRCGLSKRGVTSTYVMIEGCPKHLGCTVVLRGADKAALKQVKNVFRFIVSASYNLKLELSYLKERCARLKDDFKVEKKNLFSSSLCIDYGTPPGNRSKVRPWNGGANNEGIQRSISGQVTAFDHQSILITSVWMTDKTQCCPAEVKGICYYSMQDVSLGQFLRDSCFNLSLKCQNPSCKKSVLDHSLSFVHNDGLINITVDHMNEELPPTPATGSGKKSEDDSDDLDDAPIATWTYCKNCAKVVTPLVWLSENTWKFSFGKFLESFFYNHDTIMNSSKSQCQCELQKSGILFFGCGRLAARFTYERIRPFGVFVRKSLSIDASFHLTAALRQLEKISMASSLQFVKFDKHIEKVAREARSLLGGSANHQLKTVLAELNRISNEVDHAAKTLQEKIASVSDKCLNEKEGSRLRTEVLGFPWLARRYLFMLTSTWNAKLSAVGQAISAAKKLDSANVPAIVGDQNADELNEGMMRLRQLHEVYSRYNLTDIHTVLPTIPGSADQKVEVEFDDDFEDAESPIDFSAEGVDADVLASRRRLYHSNTTHQSLDVSRATRRDENDSMTNSQITAKVTPGGAVKSAITRFFNRGGRDRDLYTVDLGMFQEGRPRLEPGVNGIVVPVFDEQLATVIAYSLSSKEYDSQFQNYSSMEAANPETPTSSLASPPSDATGASAQQHQLPPRGGTSSSAQTPSGASSKQGIERRMLLRNKSHIKHTFRDFDEKGQSLCKFVITHYWATQFHAVREAFLSPSSGLKEGAEAQPGFDVEQSYVLSLSSAFSWAASGGKSGASFARTADDRFVIKHISRTELQMFLDCAPAYFEYLSKAFFHGLPTVLCKIVGVYQIGYHNRETGKRSMEQIAVMQNIFYNKKITKTFDLKGSLRGRFAAHIKGSMDEQSQFYEGSTSGGLDHTSGQRRQASVQSNSDMEGSDLDAHGNETGTPGGHKRGPGTLLDGDFLEFTCGRPMPMLDRAKAVFHMSVLNDTLFLSIINVLDYSILVGIDEEKMELVVGIIDFMRQYDILKQMERVGKSLPMVVGAESPTIIQPPLYKARFTNAMERYFMTVPSKWTSI